MQKGRYYLATKAQKNRWKKLYKPSDLQQINELLDEKMKIGTIRQAFKAGATPNKFLFDAIVKYYEGKVSVK